LIYEANGLKFPPTPRLAPISEPIRCRWKNPEELAEYLESWGGRLVRTCRRRRGYLVVNLEEGMEPVGRSPSIAEVPMDFATKVLVMGGFP
jgi:hypothetical protein